MKQRSGGSRLSAERRAVSALPSHKATGERTSRDPRLRKAALSSSGLASGSTSGRGLSLSCSSETFHNWLSRASSAISVRSTGSFLSGDSEREGKDDASLGHRRCQSSCSSYVRQTRASMLRLNSTPIEREQPTRGYQDIIKKRKDFIHRCKSLSASNVRCKTLPDGEPLHAFITGARYNRAHNMDSRSLERVGLYIPRRDATRSFVNHAGTLPSSPEIYDFTPNRFLGRQPSLGLPSTIAIGGVNSRKCMSDSGVSQGHYHHYQWPCPSEKTSERFERSSSTKSTFSGSTIEVLQESTHHDQQQQAVTGSGYNTLHIPHNHRQNSSLLIRGYHGNQVKGDIAVSLQQRDGVVKPCGQRPIISMKCLTNTSPGRRGVESPTISQDLRECASSRNEADLVYSCESCDRASPDNSSDVLLRADRKHVNSEDSNLPQHSNIDPPTTIESIKRQTETSLEQLVESTREEEGDREQKGVLTTLEGGVQQEHDLTKEEGEVKQQCTILSTVVGEQHSILEAGINQEVAVLITLEGDTTIRPQHFATTLMAEGDRGATSHVEVSSEDELISPEARALITDEILKECQQSSSSFSSSSLSQEVTNGITRGILTQVESTRTPTAELSCSDGPLAQDIITHVSTESENKATVLFRQSSNNLAAASAGDLQAGGSELSIKSSCIFVDMSTLNLDQVQADEEVDHSSND